MTGDEWYINDNKNIQKFQQFRLLGSLIFHIQGNGMLVLPNPWEILVKELFFNTI